MHMCTYGYAHSILGYMRLRPETYFKHWFAEDKSAIPPLSGLGSWSLPQRYSGPKPAEGLRVEFPSRVTGASSC